MPSTQQNKTCALILRAHGVLCASRWFKDDVSNLRWKCPYYPDMSLPVGNGQGQAMPSYSAIDPAKYGKRVLLERIVRLLMAVKLYGRRWLKFYISSTRSLHGELPLCKAATECLDKLLRDADDADMPQPFQVKV